jgi:hypothetical protein
LKGVYDLLPTMHFMRASLGVRCEYCHITDTGQYRRDDKPAKVRARQDIIMTRQLNETAYGGRQVITCYTCHHGSPKPAAIPKILTDFVNTTKVEPFEAPPLTFPSANEILAKYEAAAHISTLGPALLRLDVRRGKLISGNTGSGYMLPRGEPYVAEAIVDGDRGATNWLQANGQMVRIGSNGKRLWYTTPTGPQWLNPADPAQFKRRINPLLVLRIRPADYSSITVVGSEKVDGVDAYILDAMGTDGLIETMWFSKRDGLLMRRTYFHSTLLGPEPEQYDLTEYKRFGALRLPMVINASYLDDQHLGVLRRVVDVKLGVAIADSNFEPPASGERVSPPR